MSEGTPINQKVKNRVNRDITAREVRVIDADGEQLGIISLREALAKAEEAQLDLVEIASNSTPPVCRIMDFGKFKFQQSKKQAAAKKKQKQIQVKEIKFRPTTEDGDYQVKLRNIMRFLENGDKAKITLRYRGREMAHKELGMELMQRIKVDVAPLGQVELEPKLEGRQMVMVIGPKRTSE